MKDTFCPNCGNQSFSPNGKGVWLCTSCGTVFDAQPSRAPAAPFNPTHRMLVTLAKAAMVCALVAVLALAWLISQRDDKMLEAHWSEDQRAEIHAAYQRDQQEGGTIHLSELLRKLEQDSREDGETGERTAARRELLRPYKQDIELKIDELVRSRWMQRMFYALGGSLLAAIILTMLAKAARHPNQRPTFWG